MTPLTRAEQQAQILERMASYREELFTEQVDALRAGAAALRASAPPETTTDQSRSDQSATPESDPRAGNRSGSVLRDAVEACRAYMGRYEGGDDLKMCHHEMRDIVTRAKAAEL